METEAERRKRKSIRKRKENYEAARESPSGSVHRTIICLPIAEACHGAMICLLQSVLVERPVVDAARVDAAEHSGPSARIVPGKLHGPARRVLPSRFRS